MSYGRRCSRQCPEGNPCALSADIRHSLCTCEKPRCACHSEARYLAAKRFRGKNYVEEPALLESELLRTAQDTTTIHPIETQKGDWEHGPCK